MEKLPMCRICLVANVRILVVNKNLHEVYEKLTDIPFVTEDRRPMLACFFCCAKLKQCYRLMRQSLEAEKLFAQMMTEGYEPNPLINQEHLQLYGGFIKSPTENISIVDGCQTESIAIKEELPAVCEGLDDIIEPKEEHQNDELEPENLDISCLDVADIRPHHSEFLEVDVPLVEYQIEVEEEQEISKKKRRARETTMPEPEISDNSCLDVADIRPNHSEFFVVDVPVVEFQIEVEVEQEVSKNKRRARVTKRTTVAKKPKLETRRTNPEDAITAERTTKEKSGSKAIRINQESTSKASTHFKEPYKCSQSSFNPVEKIIQHTRTQTGEKPYKCAVCQHSFSKKCNLTNHMRKHTGEKPYKCDVCQRSFSVKSNLSQHHIRKHTGERPYKCDVCLLSFSRKCDLTQHIRIHTGEKPYKCDVCQRSFSQRRSLSVHIRMHTGEKPYKCNLCQRSFSQKCYLTEHIRIHTGEKPYKCDVCQSSFNYKNNLTQHIRIHTGEKPFRCDVCQRTFSNKSHLKEHIRIHTGEKPYKCDICQSSFSYKSHLNQHIRIHTGEKPYKCDVCHCSFRVKSNLSQHNIRKHTGEKRDMAAAIV